MSRIFWYAMLLAVVLAFVAGVSWAMAYYTVNDLLGAPPPDMGRSSTTFLWSGVPRLPTHPKAWRFTFVQTRIVGAPNVRIFVSPMGRLLQTEPANLAGLLKAASKNRGFN